jgi:hypothetical protein
MRILLLIASLAAGPSVQLQSPADVTSIQGFGCKPDGVLDLDGGVAVTCTLTACAQGVTDAGTTVQACASVKETGAAATVAGATVAGLVSALLTKWHAATGL